MSGKRGVFITFEGGDGSGKSTQLRLLAQALQNARIDAVTTREPGGTPQAEKIRDLLLQRDSGDFDPLTEALLMSAARREHLVQKILPALAAGQWVVSDRFADSTYAFQGFGRGIDLDVIGRIYDLIAGDFKPDLTLVFDIDPAAGLARSAKRSQETVGTAAATEDRFERIGVEFHTRLRNGFLDIVKKDPARCVLIDADADIATLHARVIDIVNRRFNLSLREVENV